jgi:predicted MFS family arabinose efflux permease
MRRPLIEGFRSPCPCGSNRRYGLCCLRLEAAYFMVASVAGALLIGCACSEQRHNFPWVVGPVLLGAGLVAWLLRRRHRRRQEQV